MILEVCVDSFESANNAINGGANRLELCSALAVGGLTPSPAFVRVIKEYFKSQNVSIFSMVRPRGGPMYYSCTEKDIILGEIKDLKEAGSDGLVFGALTEEGNVDVDLCRDVIKAAGNLECTFHRAFDHSLNPLDHLDTIISLGFQRLLTSGCCSSALEGAPLIKQFVDRSAERLTIMAGAGITSNNVQELIKLTGVNEIHSSAKQKKILTSPKRPIPNMGISDDRIVYITSATEVKRIKENMNI